MNKLIVVTGGTKGIGRAILKRFALAKFDVVTCSRNGNDLKELAAELEAEFNIRAFIKVTDMADKEQVKLFAEFIINLNRPIDVLVNNAGFFVPGSVLKEAEGSLESMIDRNVLNRINTQLLSSQG